MDDRTTIKAYAPEDEHGLFAMIEREGEDWQEYWRGAGKAKYQKALSNSITYVAYEGEVLCGYARCRNDDGYGIYILDLLVDKQYRGNDYGRQLMENVCHDFSNDTVYVTGDVYLYYEKLGYEVEGKIYRVKAKPLEE